MRKKLLIISSLYPNPKAVVRGTFVREQAQKLAEEFEVRVIAFEFPAPPHCERWWDDKIRVDYIWFPLVKNIFPSALLTFFLYANPVIKRLAMNWHPDIIHVHDYAHFPALYLMQPWLSKLKAKKILTLHNLKSIPGKLNRHSTNALYAKTMAKALHYWDKIFTVNAALQSYVAKYNPNTECIGNGINAISNVVQALPAPIDTWIRSDAFHIISVSNLVPSKGLDLLIEAMKILRDEGKKCQLLIVGDGIEKVKLQGLIHQFELHDSVFLHPPMENSVLRSILGNFDAFVLPSYQETFGIVYLEAMYAGLPVVGVVDQGIWNLFEDATEALFAKAQDLQSLVEKITLLYESPSLCKTLSTRAKAKVEQHYMLDGIISKLQMAYLSSKIPAEKRCIVHIPWQLSPDTLSATEIRPRKMRKAFEDIGYKVFFIMGDAKKRKEQIAELRRQIKSGVRYDFIYSESSTLPMLLTEAHHLPTHPWVDISLFELCKNNGIPIGLFYRDIYWADSEVKRFGTLKNMIARLFHQLDILLYNRYLNLLFFPSNSKAVLEQKVPLLDKKLPFRVLMPGTEVLTDSEAKDDYFVFIGDTRPDLYDISLILKVFAMFPQHRLVVCTPQKNWQIHKEHYSALLKENISIVHLLNEEAKELLSAAKYALSYFPDNEYRKIAIPFKIFEYVSHHLPIICNVFDASGQLIKQNKLGFALEYSEQALSNLLANLPSETEYNAMIQDIKAFQLEHTWQKRAETVVKALQESTEQRLCETI